MSYMPRHPFQRVLNEELPPSISGAMAYGARNPFMALYQQELPPSISGAMAYGARNPFMALYQQELPPSISGHYPHWLAACLARGQRGYMQPQPGYGYTQPQAQAAYGYPQPQAAYGYPQAQANFAAPLLMTPFGNVTPNGAPVPTPAAIAQAAAQAPDLPLDPTEIPPFGAMSPQPDPIHVAGIGAALRRTPGWQQAAAHQAAMQRVNAARAAQAYGAGGHNYYPPGVVPVPTRQITPSNQFANVPDGNLYSQGQLGRMLHPRYGRGVYPSGPRIFGF